MYLEQERERARARERENQYQGKRHDLRRMQERFKRNDCPFTLLHALLNKIKHLLLLSLRCDVKSKIKRDKSLCQNKATLLTKKETFSREVTCKTKQRGNEEKKRFDDLKH